MGLFGFGKKKENEPLLFIDLFVLQRVEGTPGDQAYSAILWQPCMRFFVYDTRYLVKEDAFPIKAEDSFLIDGRKYVKLLKSNYPELDESAMDPIPKKTINDYISAGDLIKKTAERGYAKAALFNYLYAFYKSWRWDKPEYKTDAENVLRFSCGEQGEKYADIMERFKKEMMVFDGIHVSQEESYLTTVAYVMRADKEDQLSDIKYEYHRGLCEYMREVLTTDERHYLYRAAVFVEFLMAADDYKCPYSSSKLAYCLAHSISTQNKNYMMKEYDIDPSHITEEDMGKAANQIIARLRQMAREGNSYAAKSLSAFSFN